LYVRVSKKYDARTQNNISYHEYIGIMDLFVVSLSKTPLTKVQTNDIAILLTQLECEIADYSFPPCSTSANR